MATLLEKFGVRALALLGLGRDVFRIGESEVGYPFLWVATQVIDATTTLNFTVEQPADGLIRSFSIRLEDSVEPSAVVDAYTLRVEAGGRPVFRNVGAAPGGPAPTAGIAGRLETSGWTMPVLNDGFLRRLPMYMQSVWSVTVVNNQANAINWSMFVEQYSIPASVVERLKRV